MSTLRLLIRLCFSLIAFCLLLTFFIRIFAPGNADTEAVFKIIALVQPWLDRAVHWLIWPIDWACDRVLPFLPSGWKSWFPLMPAHTLIGKLVEWILKIPNLLDSSLGLALRHAELKTLFPGVADWRLLLALPLWGWIERLCLGVINRIDARLYREKIRQRDAAYVQSLQDHLK